MCSLSMYCVVICLLSKQTVLLVLLLVGTRGYVNLTFCHSSAILQGQFNNRMVCVGMELEGVLFYKW